MALPTSDAALVAFPGSTSDKSASQKAPSTTPCVVFAPEVGTPERSATPDPESETKRKRISSLNFHRLARRISIMTRRAGSLSGLQIPILGNLRRNTTSASSSAPTQASTDSDAGAEASSESPAPSNQSESDKDKAKKDKKKKRFRCAQGPRATPYVPEIHYESYSAIFLIFLPLLIFDCYSRLL